MGIECLEEQYLEAPGQFVGVESWPTGMLSPGCVEIGTLPDFWC